MSGLCHLLRKYRYLFAVTEIMNFRGFPRCNSLWLPLYREETSLKSHREAPFIALGAGNRQFESGHPEYNLFLYLQLQRGVFLCFHRNGQL